MEKEDSGDIATLPLDNNNEVILLASLINKFYLFIRKLVVITIICYIFKIIDINVVDIFALWCKNLYYLNSLKDLAVVNIFSFNF